MTLTYSFPWTSAETATFSGYSWYYWTDEYSSLDEHNATSHYGLSWREQAAAGNALQLWSNVANIVFSEVAESNFNVGDVRFSWTSAVNLTGTNEQAWGWGYYPSAYSPAAGDIWISTESSGYNDLDWSASSYNFYSLVHEVGHALGLKHSFEGDSVLPISQDTRQYSVMSYTNHPHSLFVSVIEE